MESNSLLVDIESPEVRIFNQVPEIQVIPVLLHFPDEGDSVFFCSFRMGGQGRKHDFISPFDIGQEMGIIPQEEGEFPEGMRTDMLRAEIFPEETADIDRCLVFRFFLEMGNKFRRSKDRPVRVGNAAVRSDTAHDKGGFVQTRDFVQQPVCDSQVDHPGSHRVPPVFGKFPGNYTIKYPLPGIFRLFPASYSMETNCRHEHG